MGDYTKSALRLLHLPLEEIAEGVGVGYDTVKGWSSGRSDPSLENRAALATFMRHHAEEVARVAEEMTTLGPRVTGP